MKTAHTKGPWTIEKFDNWDKCINIVGNTAWYQPGLICSVDHDDCDHGEMEANARLIAAAPELFEACQDLLIAASESGYDGLASMRAQAAIKKANGDVA